MFGHVLHPWSLQNNILSRKNTSEGPSELSLGNPALNVLHTLELAELLQSLSGF